MQDIMLSCETFCYIARCYTEGLIRSCPQNFKNFENLYVVYAHYGDRYIFCMLSTNLLILVTLKCR